MTDQSIKTSEYRDWLKDIKQRVRHAQLKAAVQVNTELLTFYWELRADIVERQKSAKWGSGFLQHLSADLMAEFPDMKGFSYRNLIHMRNWHLFYHQHITNCEAACFTIRQQAASQLKEETNAVIAKQTISQSAENATVAKLVQIPWWHNVVIISKCKDVTEALYYRGQDHRTQLES